MRVYTVINRSWQALYYRLPFRQMTVSAARHSLFQQGFKWRLPRSKAHPTQIGKQRSLKKHAYLIAIMEMKLKCFNQTLECSKPAASSRRRCRSVVSGISTFSIAVRLRLISSSE